MLTAKILADFRCELENIGNGSVSIQIELSLEREESVVIEQRYIERTLNT